MKLQFEVNLGGPIIEVADGVTRFIIIGPKLILIYIIFMIFNKF